MNKDAPHLLKNLFRHGVIMSYPMLREVEHGGGVADRAHALDHTTTAARSRPRYEPSSA